MRSLVGTSRLLSSHANGATFFFVDLVRFITDPEHKHMTLEELMVVSAPQCNVSNETNRVLVEFTPTVPHCGMSTVIGALDSIQLRRDWTTAVGLTLRVRLLRALPERFKVNIRVKPGSHQSENERTSKWFSAQ